MNLVILFLLLLCPLCLSISPEELDASFKKYLDDQQLMGLAVQITKDSTTIYRGNFGYRDYARNLIVQNDTCFRVASLSKNVAAVGLYQLVEQGKVSLQDSLSSVLGFNVVNPYYPDISITVQMLLSHQSSINDCSTVYDGFLAETDLALNASALPNIKGLFTPGNKYYNNCTFYNKKPGTYYSYSNLGYILVGNIIEKVTGTRFDTWMSNNYLKSLGSPSYNPATLPNLDNLAVLYTGLGGKWVPTHDDYRGKFTPKNMTGYEPGTNAAVYGPHAHLRATTDQLLKHINTVRLKAGTLSANGWADIIKPRYQYHGEQFGAYNDWHYYGFGLHTTSYYSNDRVLSNRVVVGHTGSGYGLISAMYYTGPYAFAFVINGILNGYTYSNDTIYQLQRRDIYKLVDAFINSNP